MITRTSKIFVIPCLLLLLLTPGLSLAAYRVSGLVQFDYRDVITNTGGFRSSYTTFTQTYQANIGGPVYDPRVLQLQAGIGYDITAGNNAADTTSLNYNLSAVFFPMSMIGGSLYARKNNTNYQSFNSIAGYDYTTTSQGGYLHLNLSKLGARGTRGAGNNNVNNSNNNSNAEFDANNASPTRLRRLNQYLPDIVISHDHTESDSQSIDYPWSEVRDRTSGEMVFRGSSYFVNLNKTTENYRNLQQAMSYDLDTLNLASNFRIAAGGDLTVNGTHTERVTLNIVNYDSRYVGDRLDAQLSFNSDKRISHYYNYNYFGMADPFRRMDGNRIKGEAKYRLDVDVTLHGGAELFMSDYLKKATAAAPEENSRQTNVGLIAGASYAKIYRPDFLGSLGFSTVYDFTSGYANVTSETAGTPQGSGLYYGNKLNLQLRSFDWINENAMIDYTFDNRRDHSPAANQFQMQTYRLSARTFRIPRTNVDFGATYNVRTMSSNIADPFMIQQGGQASLSRSWLYNLDINHMLTRELILKAGASKSNSTAGIKYSLSTLPSQSISDNEVIYIGATYMTMITRNLSFSADLRRDHTSANGNAFDLTYGQMIFNYRIRMILVALDYKWQETVAEHGYRTTQQYTNFKVSRPF